MSSQVVNSSSAMHAIDFSVLKSVLIDVWDLNVTLDSANICLEQSSSGSVEVECSDDDDDNGRRLRRLAVVAPRQRARHSVQRAFDKFWGNEKGAFTSLEVLKIDSLPYEIVGDFRRLRLRRAPPPPLVSLHLRRLRVYNDDDDDDKDDSENKQNVLDLIFLRFPRLKLLVFDDLPRELDLSLPSAAAAYPPALSLLHLTHLPSLTGSIPSAVSSLKNLRSLELHRCNLRGQVPAAVLRRAAAPSFHCRLQAHPHNSNTFCCPNVTDIDLSLCQLSPCINRNDLATRWACELEQEEEEVDADDDDGDDDDDARGTNDDWISCTTAEQFIQRHRKNRHLSLLPFARGSHKATFTMTNDEEEGGDDAMRYIVKAPVIHHNENEFFNHNIDFVRAFEHKASCDDDLECLRRSLFVGFGVEVEEERRWLQRLPTSNVARYVGGCIDSRLGAEQFVIQRATLMLKLVYGGEIYGGIDTLPWFARLRIAENVFRLLARLQRRHLLPCSYGSHQLGLDEELNVRIFDAGHIIVHDSSRSAPLFSALACSDDVDCSMTRGAAAHCLRPINVQVNLTLHDRRCNRKTKRCVGIDHSSVTQYACQDLQPLLFPNAIQSQSLPTHQAATMFKRQLQSLMKHCDEVERSVRWSSERMWRALRALASRFDALNELEQQKRMIAQLINRQFQRFVTEGIDRCRDSVHCR